MPTIQYKGEEIYGGEYIKTFINTYQQHCLETPSKKSLFNETQLHLMIETLINFVDIVAQSFMTRGYPGDPIWIFECLLAISKCTNQDGHDRTEEITKSISKPFFEYLRKLGNHSNQPQWVADLRKTISMPHQICAGYLNSLDLGLNRLQRGPITKKQRQEAHQIIDNLLTRAIEVIKQTNVYEEASKKNQLRYNLEANSSQPKKSETNQEKSSSHKHTSSFSFFRDPASSPQRTQHPPQTLPKKKKRKHSFKN